MKKIQKQLLAVLLFGAVLAPKCVEAGMLDRLRRVDFADVFIAIFTKLEAMFPQVVRTEPCTPEDESAVNKVVAPMLEKNVKLLEKFNTQYELLCKTPWVSVMLPLRYIKTCVSVIGFVKNASKLKLYARRQSGCLACNNDKNCKVAQNVRKQFAVMKKSVDAMGKRVEKFKRERIVKE